MEQATGLKSAAAGGERLDEALLVLDFDLVVEALSSTGLG